MVQTLTDLLNTKLAQVDACQAKWLGLQESILELLGNHEADDRQGATLASQKMVEAVQQFNYEVRNPRITLATTGTTSGGKSSLVNLLCGANIMPVAVQEMSAGTVIIDHNPAKRFLRIPPVEGLPSDLSGEWTDLTDDQIQRRLKNLMESYRRLREEGREPPAPRIEMQFPTRIGMNPDLAGLPDGFRLRIIDLPGFKHIADQHNREVIHDEIKPALCLVTYNSEETDSIKQKVLLDEVVDQVREIRGSPARMLFILNRIDVFRRDDDWEGQMNRFVTKTMEQVRQSIGDALPEYRGPASELRGQPLSTGPAIYAYLARTRAHEAAIQALERIDSVYRSLIPDEAKDLLPGRISKWSAHDCKMIADAVWRSSYAADFDQTLRLHVQENLPQLLLPHLLSSVADAAGYCLNTNEQIAHAHVHSSKSRYDDECRRLASISDKLQKLREKSQQELLETIVVSNEDDLIGELTDRANELRKRYGLAKDSLVPLYDWHAQLGKTIDKFLTSIHDVIISQQTIPTGHLIDLLPAAQQQKLVNAVKQLRDSGYSEYAQMGAHLEARTTEEKGRLKAINQAINELSSVLAVTLKPVLDRTAEQEADRIQTALQTLILGYAGTLTKQAQTLAPDLSGLSFMPSSVMRVKQKLVLHFVLNAGFAVHRQEEKVLDRWETKKVGEERIWYTLWIKKRDVYKSEPVYEMRTWEQAIIPGITEIFNGFIAQAKASRPEGEFARWLENQIEHFLSDVQKYQEDLLNQYRSHLDQARRLSKDTTDQEVALWEERLGDIAELRNELLKLNEVG